MSTNRIADYLTVEPAAIKRARAEGKQDGFEEGRVYERRLMTDELHQWHADGYRLATHEADLRNKGLCWVTAAVGIVVGCVACGICVSIVWHLGGG